MAKRGRPPTGGAKDGSVLVRASFALAMFEEARKRGEKYEVAVKETVRRMHERFPSERFSETELKRVLHEFQPKGATEVFHFVENEDGFGGVMKVGPRDERRVNRKNRPEEDDNSR